MIYLDTSTLTKLLVDEPETVDLRAWLVAQRERGEFAATSTLGRVELMRAVARYGEHGGVERARYLLDGLDVLPLSDAVTALAETIGPATLRSRDAIHIAAAAQLGPALSAVVTYDHRMIEGCHDVGLATASPGVKRASR